MAKEFHDRGNNLGLKMRPSHILNFHIKIEGFHVIATARNKEALDEISKNGMTAIPLDVTSANSIEACRRQVGDVTSGLDILINNAYV